jgi:hypothetical protein
MGYSHIPQKYAAAVNQFYSQTFNPYLNFHRPCYFALDTRDEKGKIKKTYPQNLIQTPFQRLQSIKDYARYLQPGITPAGLEQQSLAISDNEAAKQVQQARKLLFQAINRRSKSAA